MHYVLESVRICIPGASLCVRRRGLFSDREKKTKLEGFCNEDFCRDFSIFTLADLSYSDLFVLS